MAAGDRLQGRRVYLQHGSGGTRWLPLGDKGTYGQDESGLWWAHAPRGPVGSLDDHQVIEHEDGTITVSPSIEWKEPWNWHGWLEKGVWREV